MQRRAARQRRVGLRAVAACGAAGRGAQRGVRGCTCGGGRDTPLLALVPLFPHPRVFSAARNRARLRKWARSHAAAAGGAPGAVLDGGSGALMGAAGLDSSATQLGITYASSCSVSVSFSSFIQALDTRQTIIDTDCSTALAACEGPPVHCTVLAVHTAL